jgi:hypothetical protein
MNFTYVDFADLFQHMWSASKTAGFSGVYITRLDGKRIGKRELKMLQSQVQEDMYYDYTEEEVSVDVYMSEYEDTAYINAAELDDFEPDFFHLNRMANFVARFGE